MRGGTKTKPAESHPWRKAILDSAPRKGLKEKPKKVKR